MGRVTRRVLFILCSLLYIFSLFLPYVATGSKIVLLIVSAVTVIPFLIQPLTGRCRADIKRCVRLGCAAMIIACVISVCFIDIPRSRSESLIGTTLDAEITITEVRHTSSYYGYYLADVTSGSGTFMVSLGMPDGSASVGDVFTGSVSFSAPSPDEASYLYADGVYLEAESEDVTFVKHRDVFSIKGAFSSLNAALSARLRGIDASHGELASAVLLGDRDHLGTALKRDFSRLGIFHLLAVSGIHLSVIIGFVSFFTDRSRLHRIPGGIVKALCILAFMALTGFSASVTRAGIMHLIATAAGMFDKDGDSLTSLSLAAVLIVILDPTSVYDIGLTLSVLAAYACISYSILTDRRRSKSHRPTRTCRLLRSVVDTILLTLLINAVTLPVTWLAFDQLSVASPIANVIFIPLVTVLLFCAVIYLPLSLMPYLSYAAGFAVSVTEDVIAAIASAVSPLPHITVSMHHVGVGFFAVLLFLSVLPAALVSKRTRRLLRVTGSLSVIGLIACISAGLIISHSSCDVFFTVRGKSEGLVLRDGNSYTVIDVSDGSSGIQYELLSTAEDAGAVEIRTIVLTHYHKKHLASVVKTADRTIVRRLLIPEPECEADEDICDKLTASMVERGVKVERYRRDGDTVCSDGGLSLKPHAYAVISRSTHPIISFAFSLGGRDYVYTGGSAAEGSVEVIQDISDANTVFFGAHPPVTKRVTGLSPTGDAVVSDVAVTDMLSECLTGCDKVITVADGETFRLGAYKKGCP